MFKILVGILLIQLVTAGLVFISIGWSQEPQLIIIVIAFGLILAVLTTFWFGSIVQNMQQSSQAKLQAKHAQDRERILRRAEREKAKVTSESYRQIEKAAQKARAKANFKMGAALAIATGVGGFLILSQLVTVGMMILVASGSGLAGYLIRVRQDRLSWKNQLPPQKIIQTITRQTGGKKTLCANTKLKTPK